MIDQIDRRLLPAIRQRITETPVLLLEGPRSVGKSTLLTEVAAATPHARVFDFDDDAVLELSRHSPSLITDEQLPVFLDEYQRMPSILQSIKTRLNSEARAGMFVLAGSASYDSLPSGTQALTGRIQRLPVLPLSQTEIDGTGNRFIERAFDGDIARTADAAAANRLEYIDRISRGGMPLALAQSGDAARGRWFAGRVSQSLRRDAGQLRRLERSAALPKLLTAMAGQTAGVLNISKVSATLEISRSTVSSYLELLEALFLISSLPAWGTTVSSRSVAAPKIHVVDSGIGAHLLRLSRPKLERGDPSALTEFGHLAESFVVQEIIRQTTWMDDVITAGHWRTRDGDEVDLVLERQDGAVLGIEVKAGDHIDSKQLSGLRKLRDRLGAAFVGGIAFHLGSRGYPVEDRIHSLPVERLWV
ncbi:ATP-binding protein [Kocuria palustris]|jgi:predicted AAA+ superfamily ATPase|uniref:ATP-binding protein n=1 Tax=Kocuria TaxID=57493 RepID=UPI0010F5AB9D|nr:MULTISPECIES: ATP-binding protein [Kocuria]MBN6754316.1 ATP-binding protein [Kocuria palustris]MBN6759271.1 ATP-binding protein [Kocuria palustris]MBN6764297.1 ATP-binding protein [Kocuria palustris]MBN6783787.1 ATP-binding protein [Kocuria palustris]MBN6800269.1 ATP-binding protein [Kocuria palustris]